MDRVGSGADAIERMTAGGAVARDRGRAHKSARGHGLIDLHCHLLPAVDDGASSLEELLEMARMMAREGVKIAACTPHMMPGVFNNDGWTIRERIAELQQALNEAGIALRLVVGGDVHISPDLVGGLRSGALLSLNDTRFVLIEPPHHILPPRLDEAFFDLITAGYVPVLTHPERLSWIDRRFDVVRRLFKGGVWMQITAGALVGDFGKKPLYWAERMLCEGMCHILASDAHNIRRRPPKMRVGFERAAALVGSDEAINMVLRRPYWMLENQTASAVVPPTAIAALGQCEAPRNRESLRSRVLTGIGLMQ